MILPDVNVLVYAFRTDSAAHDLCETWLLRVVSGPARFGISPVALSALVRVTTNTRTFRSASSLNEAFEFCDFLLNQPHCQIVEPGQRHWDIFKQLCATARMRGPQITDAWYAALAIEWGCEWVTFDRDYARFPGLKWRLPSLED